MSVQASDSASSWDDGTLAKVRYLRDPSHYPDSPDRVEVIETHYAWLFLTGKLVYKFKKPIRHGAVDYRALECRRENCEAEVRLNRELAADTYLGLATLNRDRRGRLQLEGTGEPVEWLVKMRQLPRERMLDAALAEGRLTVRDIDSVLGKLVKFYARAPIGEQSPATYHADLQERLIRARRELLRGEFGLDQRLVGTVIGALLDRLGGDRALFDARVLAGRVREIHGDLKPEHVCLAADPQIIDRLEFDRRLRILDCAEEIAFLAMECDSLGGRWAARTILRRYTELADDPVPEALLGFHLAQRAVIRAMLAVWHLDDGTVAAPDHWRGKAARYLRLAHRYLRRPAALLRGPGGH